MENSVTADKADDLLTTYRQQITEFIDNTTDERNEAELHRDYTDGIQYTADEIEKLKARGQPVITDNKIKDKVEYMEGVERKTRTDPKCFPRTKAHEQDAEVATDAIRYVFDKNRFSQVKSAVFTNMLVEGLGGAEVIVDKKDPTEIRIRKIRWDRIYRDPYSMEHDFSDAMYRGVITWMDTSRAKEKWKKKAEIIESTLSQAPVTKSADTTDDKPRWADSKRKRIQVFEHYAREGGKIMRSVFCWGGFLEEPEECPYLNDEGEHEDPMILASAYVDREGRRYGVVKRYISLQDEVNKRRSKSLHLLNSVQVIAEKGAVDDIKIARDMVHKPDGYVERNPGLAFEVERHLDLSAAHFQLLQQAENALSVTGPNAALLGQSGSISGRAKELDQQGGAIQIGPLFDAIRDWQLRVARAVWNRIRQYWDQEMWIRVTDDDTGFKFVVINQPMVQGDVMAEKLRGQPPEVIQQQVELIAQDPNSQQPVYDETGRRRIKNEVAKLDVDIIIDEAPDVVNIQAEEFQKLIELAKVRPEVPFDVLLETAQLRSDVKRRVVAKLKENQVLPPQLQAELQQQQEAMQVAADELKKKETDLTSLESSIKEQVAGLKVEEANLDVKRAEIKAAAADLKVMEAEIDAKRAEIGAAEAQLGAEKAVAQAEIGAAAKEVKLSEEAAHARLKAGEEGARSRLVQESAKHSQKTAADSSSVVTQIAKLLEKQNLAVDAVLKSQSAEAPKAKIRRLVIDRGPDGRAVGLTETEE